MDAQQFAYWLQGFAELSGDAPPSKAQWKSIREHLALVFRKVTPPVQPAHIPGILPDIIDPSKIRIWRSPTDAAPFLQPPTVTCSASQCVGSDDRGDVMVIC